MSKNNKEDETSKTSSTRSSYFQTEFTNPHKSCSSEDEVHSINNKLKGLSIDVRQPESLKNSSGSISKVDRSVQTGRSILEQDNTSQKERKRWVRPPGVGQASNKNEQNVIVTVSYDVESSSGDDTKTPVSSLGMESVGYSSDNHQYKKHEKPTDISLDQSLLQISGPVDIPPVVSPSSVSSITNRPLEWDSGADVGYFQNYGASSRTDQEFSSTMERIALVQGRSGIIARSDPEGKSSSKKNNSAISAIGLPTAESTHINLTSVDRSSILKSVKSTDLKEKYHPLFPEVIIQYKGEISDSSNEYGSRKMESKKCDYATTKESKLKKSSSSLENVNKIPIVDSQSHTFPRSISQISVSNELDYNSHTKQALNPPQSVSSSSPATVISGIPNKSKSIQTSHFKNYVDVQSSQGRKSSYNNNENEKKIESSTIDSAQFSSDDRVNSFEYLPGHVYENVNKTNSADFWDKTKGLSLQDDVHRGVKIMEEFIQGSNANNTLKKNELLHRVVNKLIKTDYPDDIAFLREVPLHHSVKIIQSRQEVIGESSSGTTKGMKSKVNSSSTLSGDSISVGQTSTEANTSSEKDIPKLKMKSQGSENSKKSDPEICKDKSSDLSSDSKYEWKEPVTRTEKLFEMQKSIMKDDQLVEFMKSERENQMDWIVKEINHLSNLKTLLEKHEKLRKNLNHLKAVKSRSDRSPNKQHLNRPVGFKRRTHLSGRSRETNLNSKKPPELEVINEDKGWVSHDYEADSLGKLKRTVPAETRKENLRVGGAKPLAYTITFNPEVKPQKVPEPEVKHLIADRETLKKESKTRVREAFCYPSLQECLVKKRPDIVTRAEVRRQTVAELTAVRQVREEKRPEVLAAAINCETNTIGILPVSLVKRVVSQKEMRKQTEKKYRKTFEVKKKISDEQLKEKHRSNRLMAEIFNKRLQLLTLKGHTNLSNSLDVISTI